MMLRMVLSLGVGAAVVACTTSTTLPPAVTCNATLQTMPGVSCDFTTNNQPCSDGQVYEIDCQDDGTCSCSIEGVSVVDFIADNDIMSGYCATVTMSDYAKLSQQCCQSTADAGLSCWNLVAGN